MASYRQGNRLKVIFLLGGKCARCGCGDLRVLQINHINGKSEVDKKHYERYAGYGGSREMCLDILLGKRSTDNLNVLCANCNIIYEFERGKRKSFEVLIQKEANAQLGIVTSEAG